MSDSPLKNVSRALPRNVKIFVVVHVLAIAMIGCAAWWAGSTLGDSPDNQLALVPVPEEPVATFRPSTFRDAPALRSSSADELMARSTAGDAPRPWRYDEQGEVVR